MYFEKQQKKNEKLMLFGNTAHLLKTQAMVNEPKKCSHRFETGLRQKDKKKEMS